MAIYGIRNKRVVQLLVRWHRIVYVLCMPQDICLKNLYKNLYGRLTSGKAKGSALLKRRLRVSTAVYVQLKASICTCKSNKGFSDVRKLRDTFMKIRSSPKERTNILLDLLYCPYFFYIRTDVIFTDIKTYINRKRKKWHFRSLSLSS